MSEHTTCHKTFKYKLIPTPEKERELECVLLLCQRLYNAALEQRITAWQRCRISVSRFEQEAELKEIRAAFPEYAAIHSHLLQDVLARLDRTFQAFFRRVQRGEKAGFPRFKPATRFTSFTYKEIGSSVNDSRPKFLKLLADPTVETLVVEHNDRARLYGQRRAKRKTETVVKELTGQDAAVAEVTEVAENATR